MRKALSEVIARDVLLPGVLPVVALVQEYKYEKPAEDMEISRSTCTSTTSTCAGVIWEIPETSVGVVQ